VDRICCTQRRHDILVFKFQRKEILPSVIQNGFIYVGRGGEELIQLAQDFSHWGAILNR
jgi:hypothetical protein